MKPKYRGTTYDVFLKDTRKKNGNTTSTTLMGKSKEDVRKQAKKTYKPFMKITKIKLIDKTYR